MAMSGKATRKGALLNSGTLSPNPWDLTLSGQNVWPKLEGTRTEDKPPQGCALSAASSAGWQGRLQCPGRPEFKPTPPDEAYCGQKMVLTEGSTLHFNKSNALSWAITMGLFAMPVIYSDREWNQIVGESYYIQLGPTDRFGWTEPDGKVYQIAANNLESLKEEMYRVCYLTQASGEMVSGHAQSAVSKQMDFAITQEVLRTYSSVVKECIRQVLNAISGARQDGVLIAVSGLDEVDISDFATDLQDAKDLLQIGIDSPTLKRQIYQRLALKYLNDARQEMKDQIAREINAQFSN
jgi:hypothetical protein